MLNCLHQCCNDGLNGDRIFATYMEKLRRYTNHRAVVLLYLFLLPVLFFKVYDRVFDKKVHLGGDNAGYYIYGKSIAKGEGYVALHDVNRPKANHFPPGYPALIALTMKTFSGKVNTIKSANGFYFLAALFVLFFLFRALTLNIHLSFIACLLTLYNYHLLQYSTIMMSEISYVLFSSISLLLFAITDFNRPSFSNWRFILFCLMLVLSFYIRTMGISLFLSFMLILLIQKRWKYAGLLVGIFILLVAPWQIRSHSLGGNTYVNQLLMKNPYRPELGKMELADWPDRVIMNAKRYLSLEISSGVLPFETIDYKQTVRQLKKEAGVVDTSKKTEKKDKQAKEDGKKKENKNRLVSPPTKKSIAATDYIISLLLLILMAIGLARMKDHRMLIGLYIAGTFGILAFWPEAWFGVRFMLPLIPILILLTLNGLVQTPLLVFSLMKKKEPWILTLIIPLLVFIPVYGKLDDRIVELEKQAKGIYINKFKNYFDLASWANRNLKRDAVVSCRKGQLFYLYANRYVTGFKNTLDREALVAKLTEKGATHVVLDQLGYASTSRYLYPAIKRYPGKFKVIHQLKNPDTYIMEFNPEMGYTGQWEDDKKHGNGIYRWANGMVYDGEWAANRRTGQGKFTWPNGQVFNGTWVADRRNGPGSLLMPDSTRVDGIWKADVLNGKVKMYDRQGNFVEDAVFNNNQKVG